jgi:hypothetical protein
VGEEEEEEEEEAMSYARERERERGNVSVRASAVTHHIPLTLASFMLPFRTVKISRPERERERE